MLNGPRRVVAGCPEMSIVYFGMTNGTLQWRLDNFHNTVTLPRCEHGGAERFV